MKHFPTLLATTLLLSTVLLLRFLCFSWLGDLLSHLTVMEKKTCVVCRIPLLPWRTTTTMVQMLRSARVLSFALCAVLKEIMLMAVSLASSPVWVGGSSTIMVHQPRLLYCWFLQFCQLSDGALSVTWFVCLGHCVGKTRSNQVPKRRGKGNRARIRGVAVLSTICCMVGNPPQAEGKTFYSDFHQPLGKGREQKTEHWYCEQGAPAISAWTVSIPVFSPCHVLPLFPNYLTFWGTHLRCSRFYFVPSNTGMVFLCFGSFDKASCL